MQYPLISEYVKAIQDAGDNLDKLAYLTPVLDDHGEPYRSSGAFAVVFKMQDKRTGKYYALKCFTEEQQGRADAYRQIADELDLLDSPYIISVKYMEKELFVDSQCEEDEFPVLLMDWVDGETMEAYIAANYRNQSAMLMLSYRFGKMAAWLRTQSFSHGDIKPDNIIVRPDGSLTLVDYDGMFVPSMKGSQSPTIGTRDFSHPLRTVDDFDETIDDFSLASIALSLKAISMNSTLLDTYGASDRLLFSENDYRNPSNSKVISALQELICDKDFCTLYSLFMLALARKELSACSFRLFIGEKPNITPVMNEDLSTETTEEELKEVFVDEWGVKYSKDGRKLLKVPNKLSGAYSVKEGTRIICDHAFSCCLSLSKIVIPASVASIGEWAFWGCSSLSDIVIPTSITSIGDKAFMGCRSLSEIVLPSSVTSIGNHAFCGCISLSDIVIPTSITSIGNRAFNDCSSLSDIVIPSSVTSIGDCAFLGCSSLKYISIPKSVICLNGNPIADWDGKLECLSPNFIYEDDVLFNKDKSIIISFRNQSVESYVIPSSVTSIGNSAFSCCSSLSEVVIPSSVNSIGNSAFSCCSSLSKVVIPTSVTSIGHNVFQGCSSLSEIVIPDSVTSIGNSAFSGCSSLSKIVIPTSVTSIGDWTFSGCSSLSEIVIPSSVTCIGDDAFHGCRSLSKIVIPSSVTSIGSDAFWECRSLSDIVIPSSVTSIGSGAFWECRSLSEIVIPSSVTSIGDCAFHGCRSLSDIVIPSSVTSIGDCAFHGCRSLSKIVIPSSVTCIDDGAFWGCRSLSDIVIPSSVTSIGDSAFIGCKFPDNLKQELISRFGDSIF
jgi:serine/threonine protein kinase